VAEVEVAKVVNDAVAPLRGWAHERGIALEMVMPAHPVMAQVDAQRLTMALGNLLDNALKFTLHGGQVEVGLRGDGERVIIWVADTGMGIDEAEVLHIFERFYRSPRATQAGSGLGLAIVERIVTAHGGRIAVKSALGVGSRFTLCIPARA
jgi:signal transduction histidine kinase